MKRQCRCTLDGSRCNKATLKENQICQNCEKTCSGKRTVYDMPRTLARKAK